MTSAFLCRREMRQLDHRHLGHAELACGEQPAVASDHAVIAIDQDRIGPAEFHDARRELRNLCVAVRAWISCVRNQRLDPAGLDGEGVGHRGLEKKPTDHRAREQGGSRT